MTSHDRPAAEGGCIVGCGFERDFERGLLVCRRDWARMAARLRQIPAVCATLASLGYVERDGRLPRITFPPGHRRAGKPVPHFDPVAHPLTAGPISGAAAAPHVSGTGVAPVPVRVDVVDLLAAARPASRALLARGVLGLDEDQVGHLSAATILDTYVRDWAAVRGEGLPATPDVHTLCRWLLDRLDWACVEWLRVDEFADELRELHAALSAAAGELPARPEPRDRECPRCDMPTLVLDLDTGYTECTDEDCRALLTEDEYRDYLRALLDRVRSDTPGAA